MMARSAGFPVPAGYLTRGLPAPAPRPRWPLFAAMFSVATLLAAVAVALVAKTLDAGPAHARAASAPTVSAPPPAAEPTPPPASTPVPAVTVPTSREVIVGVTPLDARVARDAEDLGSAPVSLRLADGESASLVVTRKGYKTKTVVVDGSQPRVTDLARGARGSRPALGARPRGRGRSLRAQALKGGARPES